MEVDSDGFVFIASKSGYHFSERVPDGMIKTGHLRIKPKTCNGQICDPISSFCSIEIRFLMPIFQKYLELQRSPQDERITEMRIFLEKYKP